MHTISGSGMGDVGRRDLQPNKRKGEQCLIDPANHDAHLLVPVVEITHVPQCARHIPREQAPAERPDNCQERIYRDV